MHSWDPLRLRRRLRRPSPWSSRPPRPSSPPGGRRPLPPVASHDLMSGGGGRGSLDNARRRGSKSGPSSPMPPLLFHCLPLREVAEVDAVTAITLPRNDIVSLPHILGIHYITQPLKPTAITPPVVTCEADAGPKSYKKSYKTAFCFPRILL